MPAPERNWITFTVDGLEVRAPEGELLLEASKRGDVEIPFFCYERKLGPPVGACRMCLVEIEGMPKLQVSCATPVKDGMVVSTQSERVKHAQNAVVEFLLVNHPLDCPVCDKGGECPLQDISFGWGAGRSRFVEQKRNFPKPIALSPLVAIDRERCILCYRCVRFSQEVSEDHQLVFLDRADHTFVGTFDGLPYVAPFAGNVIELCPVGALTSTAYRFRARPWEIEDAGSICTLCPSQCNIKFTVRDEQVERVLARENEAVDDGWLCDKGRYGYQAIHSPDRITQPLVRDGGHLRPATWERAVETAVAGLRKAGSAAAALAGGETTNEEAFLLRRIFREALESGNVDSRRAGALDADAARLLARPELATSVPNIERAAVIVVIASDPIDEAPILDLRIRKAVSRSNARLVVAAAQPTALDGGASERLWFAPGGEEAFLRALAKAMLEVERQAPARDEPPADEAAGAAAVEDSRSAKAGELGGQHELLSWLGGHTLELLAALAGSERDDLLDAARLMVGAESIVILWGERIGHGERGREALRALVDLSLLAGVDGAEGSGLIEVPLETNARGLREVGFLPNLGPGLAATGEALGAPEARDAANRGELRAFYLLHADPVRAYPGREEWEDALGAASFVVAHDQFLNESIERHADVVFPAESYAEKEGTVTHPDGRLQRVRPAIGHPGGVQAEWRTLAEIGRRLGLDMPYSTAGTVLAEIGEQVPFYRGITLDEIGGRGVRWQERELAGALVTEALPELEFSLPSEPPALPEAGAEELRLVAVSDLWASAVVEHSPSLAFLRSEQTVLLNPRDAERLGLEQGDETEVSLDGRVLHATVRVREAAATGFAYLTEGTERESANALLDREPRLVRVRKVETPAGVAQPVGEAR
jgi:NADH-quinone oxidoreductase subunit G